MCLVQKSYHNKDFDGIVNFFNNIPLHSFSEYISAYGVVSGVWGPPTTVINYSITGNGKSDQFASIESENLANITIKFVYPIYFKKYTLRTRIDGLEENILTSWVVECSMDDEKFTTVDTQNNNPILREKKKATFTCSNPIISKTIRIRVTSPSGNKDQTDLYHLHLSRVEFYGSIYTPPEFSCPRFTCRFNAYRRQPPSIFFFISLTFK